MIANLEDLEARFCDLRVDFLSEDELDYELHIRGIICEHGAQMVRKRGNLREALKRERDSEVKLQVKYELDPELDYASCVDKYHSLLDSLVGAKITPARCQTTMLHLGVRIGRLLDHVDEAKQSTLIGFLEKIFELLNRF